jgi:toxin CcdB
MARFDVYKYSAAVPYVVDVQADLLSDLKTRVVIPLLPHAQAKKEVLPRLKPVIKIHGKDHVLMTTDIGAIRIADLGPPAENIQDQRQVIAAAIDFLMMGF